MSDQKNVSEDRRRFLFRAIAAAAAAGMVFPACGGTMPMSDAGDSGTGGDGGTAVEVMTGVMAADLMVGQVRRVDPMGRDPIVVGRDAMGYYAMSGLCTHEFCPVTVMSGATMIGCSCNHGSTFSLTGEVMMPATTRPVANQPPLEHKRMEIRAGQIVVFPTMAVPSTTRVMA
jgi:nitrite reductase/ring-hydroxylating ferredoxin subunit